ncbi:unnamed protein product, partial [Allacma fusca]
MIKEKNKNTPQKPENMDQVLEILGGFGKFQYLILVLILSMEIPCAFLMFVPIFIGVSPPEWLCDNDTVSIAETCSCQGTVSAIDPEATVVTEWNLICGSSWVPDAVVSDWYGRKYSFLGISAQMAFGSVLTAAAPNPYVYALARFICGSSFSGFLGLTAVYTMEFLTPNFRPVASAPRLGNLYSVPGFLPESPRWLLRNNKIEEAHKILVRMAKTNGKEPIDLETIREIAEKERAASSKDPEDTSVKRFSYLEFYQNSTLRKTTLCLQGIWFSWSMVYYGIGYYIKNLAGNPYMNMVYMGLTDATGYPTSFFFNNWLGRRRSLVVFMTLAAVALVAVPVIQLILDVNNPGLGLAIAGLCFLAKYGSAGARCAGRTLTGESYPTAIRTMGLAFSGSTSPLAAIVAPQMA